MPVDTTLGRMGGGRILGVAAAFVVGMLASAQGVFAGEQDNELRDLITGSRLDAEMSISVTNIDGATGEVLGEPMRRVAQVGGVPQ